MRRHQVYDAVYAKKDPWRSQSYFPDVLRLRRAWEWVDGRKYRTVLDIGAGEGHWSARLATISDCVVASDISLRAACRAAGEHGDVLHVVVADLGNLSFRPRSFDLVCCMTSLGCLPRQMRQGAISGIRDVLVDGGRLLLVDAVVPGKVSRGEMAGLLGKGFRIERVRAGNARVPILGRLAGSFPGSIGRVYELLSDFADRAPEVLGIHTLILAIKE